VVLDPGHNGASAAHPAEINRQVPDGRGRARYAAAIADGIMAWLARSR
jgi:N-acetylmuramoyl-L-alanine amidase